MRYSTAVIINRVFMIGKQWSFLKLKSMREYHEGAKTPLLILVTQRRCSWSVFRLLSIMLTFIIDQLTWEDGLGFIVFYQGNLLAKVILLEIFPTQHTLYYGHINDYSMTDYNFCKFSRCLLMF